MHILYAGHDGMIRLFRNNVHGGSVLMVGAVMSGAEAWVPGFAKNLTPEATNEVLGFVVVVPGVLTLDAR